MALTESVPMTTAELESLVQAINADRRAGWRTQEEADHEILWLTGRGVIRPHLRVTPQPR